MLESLSSVEKAYIAGFLDGDGSIYVRAKPNSSYKFGFQIAPYIALFQSKKDQEGFRQICSLIGYGTTRTRKDGILEHTINRRNDIEKFLDCVEPYVILKREQIKLMRKILLLKQKVTTRSDFGKLLVLVDHFRAINYSKKRKKRMLTP